MTKNSKTTILIAPLDWGLGHATRCIPIIKTLKKAGYNIVVGVNESQQKILQTEFADIKFIFLKGYEVKYSKKSWLLPLKIFVQIPKILLSIRQEHSWLKNIIQQENIDIVISDNRYGLFSKTKPSIFITHQLTIKTPYKWLEHLIRKINYSFIQHFTQCWIPDVAGDNNLAGLLSHPTKMPFIETHYIGILSRFEKKANTQKKYDICVLLSGPEPQRTILEKKLLLQLQQLQHKTILLVRGLPLAKEQLVVDGIDTTNHLQQKKLQEAIEASEIIIARSGYTTVMELVALQKKAILIPTPAQTEQVYLAQHLQKQNNFAIAQQNCLNIVDAIKHIESIDFSNTNPVIFNEEMLLHNISLLAVK